MVFLGYGGANQGDGSWGGADNSWGGGGNSWGGGGKGGGKSGGGGQWKPDTSEIFYAMQVMQALGMGNDKGGSGVTGGKGGKGKGKSGKAKQQQQQQFGKKVKGNNGAPIAPLGWKTRLVNAYSKEYKETAPKDHFVYTTSEAGDKFMCTLTCEKFATEYTTDEEHDSKKEAEEAVAEAAARGEFPQHAEALASAGPAMPKKKQQKVKVEPQQPAKKQKSVPADLPWKSRLQNAWSQEHKKPTAKDTFTYTSLASEGGSYMSTLTCENFSAEYTSEELCESKKVAEEAVAMAALKGEYPAVYAAVPSAMKKAGALGGAGAANSIKKAAERSAAGVKRKDPDAPAGPGSTDPKSLLNCAMMMLAERAMTKEDIVYTVTEVNGSMVASLKLNCFEGKNPVFKGKAVAGTSKDSKKEAQNNAAAAALKAYKAQIDAKTPEHEERKAAKKEEYAAKLAAKKAEAGEA